jgi:V8-like Glu-specific endopeptidase
MKSPNLYLLVVTGLLNFSNAIPVNEKRVDIQPIPFGYGPPEASVQRVAPPQVVTYTLEELLESAGNVTEVPPSAESSLRFLTERDVNGPDDRELQTSTDYPWISMGRLALTDGRWCSANLIGPRHISVARHCVIPGVGYTFSPLYLDGDRFATGQVTTIINLAGTISSNCDYRDDWAIMVLNQRLGERYGYLGAKTFDSSVANRPIFWNFGYPQDKGGNRPFVQDLISIRNYEGCANGGPLQCEADAAGGQSGGPVWLPPDANGARYQYGVLVAGGPGITVLSHGPSWVNAIGKARQDYP